MDKLNELKGITTLQSISNGQMTLYIAVQQLTEKVNEIIEVVNGIISTNQSNE